jgi:peptide-methionine (R)-S-oxide reductase
MEPRVHRPDHEWKQQLTPQQYHVLREQGTEAPGTGALLHEHRNGVFRCAGCGTLLFTSDTKYDSGSGWPSFTDPADVEGVRLLEDTSHGMRRTEVRCATCDGHLGHVFPDGPGTSGERYCINSCALEFAPRD